MPDSIPIVFRLSQIHIGPEIDAEHFKEAHDELFGAFDASSRQYRSSFKPFPQVHIERRSGQSCHCGHYVTCDLYGSRIVYLWCAPPRAATDWTFSQSFISAFWVRFTTLSLNPDFAAKLNVLKFATMISMVWCFQVGASEPRFSIPLMGLST
jgi:hypothetical protein